MNWVTRTIGAIWGIYAWLCFSLAVIFTLIATLILPNAVWRQKVATWSAKMTFVLARVDVEVRGLENLPSESCVVVANHASYLDGVLLKGYLPWRFNFVIKGEMRDFGPAHFVLRRSGARFVERNNIHGSARDARHIVKAAKGGESLGFFPEGTFMEEPGVMRFRPGAFVAARQGRMPVVPIAISGSRYIMPAGVLLPRRGPLTVDILPAIGPDDPEFEHSRELAEAARQSIIEALDEPDLLANVRPSNA